MVTAIETQQQYSENLVQKIKGIAEITNKNSCDIKVAPVAEQDATAWLNEQARQVKPTLTLSVLAQLLDGSALIVQSALLAFILSEAIFELRGLGRLMHPFIGLCLVFLFRAVCSYFGEVTGFKAGAEVRQSIRTRLLKKINLLGPGFVKTQHSAELSAIAIEQVDALHDYFADYLPQRSLVLMLPVVVVVVAFWINWVAGIILIITGPLVPLFMVLVGVGAEAANRKQYAALRRMSHHFLDRLRGLTTLKVFGQAYREQAAVQKVSESYRNGVMQVLGIAFLSSAVLEFFSAVAVALVAVYIGLSLLGLIEFGAATSLSYFDAVFLLLLAPDFFLPLRQFAANYHAKAAAIAACGPIINLLKAQEPVVCSANQSSSENAGFAPSYAVEFEHVHKAYDSGKWRVLKGLSFTVDTGQTCALVGPSGAGKTTVIEMMLGFESIDQGTIRINGQTVAPEYLSKVQPGVAWISQNPYIFAGSVRDNIALFDPGVSLQQIERASSAAGILDFCKKLPDGLNTQIGERGFGLSGGQRQRVALARAFLKDTPLLLLDEPTSSLDRVNANAILDTLEGMFATRTIVIATHSDAVIARADCHVRL